MLRDGNLSENVSELRTSSSASNRATALWNCQCSPCLFDKKVADNLDNTCNYPLPSQFHPSVMLGSCPTLQRVRSSPARHATLHVMVSPLPSLCLSLASNQKSVATARERHATAMAPDTRDMTRSRRQLTAFIMYDRRESVEVLKSSQTHCPAHDTAP